MSKTRSEGVNKLMDMLDALSVFSATFKMNVRSFALEAYSEGIERGKSEAAEAAPTLEGESHIKINDGWYAVPNAMWRKMCRDHNDMMSANQTIFQRCACGRMAERGIICPTNQEGGECEAGR